MNFSARHPRYSIALFILLLISILILANSDSIPRPMLFRPIHTSCSSTPAGYVEDQIKLSESYYQETLEERQQLIARWGPSPSQLQSFPTNVAEYTLWNYFPPAFQCPHRTRRIGTLADGGKWVCGLERIAAKKNCVIYSVGISKESSFEASLLEKVPGCQVYGYDYSVKSFGPEIENFPALKERAHFWPYALGGVDRPNDKPPFYTLTTLMNTNNHTFIDILKIDIEGGEFEALESLLEAYPSTSSLNPLSEEERTSGRAGDGLPFGQLQLEIHAWRAHGNPKDWSYFPRFLQWWEKLEQAGLRPFFAEPNLVYINIVRGVKPDLSEYSFINIRGSHELVSDRYLEC